MNRVCLLVAVVMLTLLVVPLGAQEDEAIPACDTDDIAAVSEAITDI